MNHGNRLHRIFALSAARSEIRSHQSWLFVPTFMDTEDGRTDNGRGDEGEVGPFEWLDRLRLIEMSVPPSRMLLRAFNL